jgi:hypothetical protein
MTSRSGTVPDWVLDDTTCFVVEKNNCRIMYGL